MNYQYLFTPLKVGNIDLPNRIILGPHSMNHGRGTDVEIAYYAERVRGGAGTVILESTRGVAQKKQWPCAQLFNDDGIEANKRTADAIHEAGGKVLVELMYMPGFGGSPQPSSHHCGLGTNIATRSLTVDEIHENITKFAEGIERAKRAGMDGVDLYAASGVSFHLFTSPLFNKRTDEYGCQTIENRTRVLVEVLEAARAKVGKDFVIGLNISVDEGIVGGTTLEDGIEMCQYLADTGMLDYLRIDANNIKVSEGHLHYPSSYYPQGTTMYACSAVREAVDSIPIFGTHHINSIDFAEQVIAEGQCDAVVMVRALIADPEAPIKAKRGDNAEIRGCIGCLEGCFQKWVTGQHGGCALSPDVGNELKKAISPASVSKKVVVVGGGPAGLEAALTAAKRGHKVTLIEKEDQLGGHIRLQAKLPGLSDRNDYIRYMTLQLSKESNLEINLNTEATAAMITAMNPDAVLLCTGSNYDRNGFSMYYEAGVAGCDEDYVLMPEDVIFNGAEIGQKVVVYDTTHYVVGPGIAEVLADQGKDVTFITDDPFPASDVTNNYISWAIAGRLFPKVQEYIRDVNLLKIEDHTITLQNRYSYMESTLEDVDTVILISCKRANEALYHELLGKVAYLDEVGDCAETHNAHWAIDFATKDGRAAALKL